VLPDAVDRQRIGFGTIGQMLERTRQQRQRKIGHPEAETLAAARTLSFEKLSFKISSNFDRSAVLPLARAVQF
jgi:hypothetical protein